MARKRKGPWLRKQDNCYYTTIRGQSIKLGSADEPYEDIEARYGEELAKSKEAVPRSAWTIAALCEAFLDWCDRRRSAGTHQWYKEYLDEFYAHPGIDKLLASKLRPFHVTDWIDARYGDCSDSTKYNATRAVVRVCNWAVKEGHLDRSPLKGIELPTPLTRESVITPAQFATILARVKDQAFRDVMLFLWNTGCRPQELRAIEARHVDGDKVTLTRKQSKGKKHRRVIYLNETAAEIVRRRCEAFPEGPIFRSYRGKRPWSKNAFKCRFQRLRKDDDKLDGLCSYTMRHSYITESLTRGVDCLTVALLCGTSVRMIEKTYQHLLTKDAFMRAAAQGGGTVPVVLATSLHSAPGTLPSLPQK